MTMTTRPAAGFGNPESIQKVTFWSLPIQMRKEAIALLREKGAHERDIARHFGLPLKELRGLITMDAKPFRGAEDIAGEE